MVDLSIARLVHQRVYRIAHGIEKNEKYTNDYHHQHNSRLHTNVFPVHKTETHWQVLLHCGSLQTLPIFSLLPSWENNQAGVGQAAQIIEFLL